MCDHICENCKHFKTAKIRKRIIETQTKFVDENGNIFTPEDVLKVYVGSSWKDFESVNICELDFVEKYDDFTCDEFEESEDI